MDRSCGKCSAKDEDNGLTPELLLDTHVLVRWLVEPKRLSREQLRALRGAVRRCEPLALSAITLLEIAVLFGEGSTRLKVPAQELLAALGPGAGFHIVPIDVEVATEVAAMGGVLRDPADRAIVATARIHRLRLVTSDQRIVESKLVPVVE
jgi:PIN domain nuclease of toxin-antitoxin system